MLIQFENFFRTNLPKILMSLPDYPMYKGDGGKVVTHQELHEYLKNYTEKFNLRKYIKVNIQNLI